MTDKIDAMSYQKIAELRARRDLAKRTLNRLALEVERIDSETKEGSERLKALRRTLAVSEREIRDSQGVVFRLNRQKKEMDESSLRLFEEIKNGEAELKGLNNSKDALNKDIRNIQSDIHDTTEVVSALEADKKELPSRIEELEAEKRKLSDDITGILSKTSLDRDKIEEELNKLSISFFDSIAGRDALKLRLSGLEKAVKEITKVVSELDEKVSLLENIKALQGERGELETDVEERKRESVSLSARLEELQRKLADKQEQADRLSTENAEQKYSVDSLEREVMVYDEAVTGLDEAQETRKRTSELVDQNRGVLKKLLVDKAMLEGDLRMVMEKVKRTVEVVKSIS